MCWFVKMTGFTESRGSRHDKQSDGWARNQDWDSAALTHQSQTQCHTHTTTIEDYAHFNLTSSLYEFQGVEQESWKK